MNLDQLGLQEGLLRALNAREPDASYPFLEKILESVNRRRESVSAQVRVGSGRELLYLVPLFQWLLEEDSAGKALVVVPSDQDVAAVVVGGAALTDALGIPLHILGRDPDPEDSSARLVVGSAETLSYRQETGGFEPGEFGFLVVDGLARFTEAPYAGSLRRLGARLRPPRERRTILFSERLGLKEQTLALELADSPAELYLEEEAEKTKHLPQTTWYVSAENKIRLLLGVLASDPAGPVAVFCNLPETAQDVVRRLGANGKRGEAVLDSLPPSRKESLLNRARSGDLEALVLTDESARTLPRRAFRQVINYDIPLEGEPYLERIRLLDESAPGARILNFACDRYVYGIPAVEQFMGLSLGAVQADEALFAPADRSSGTAPGRGARPRDDRGGWRGDRPREPGRESRPFRERSPERERDTRDPGSRARSGEGFRRDGRNRDREGDLRNQESIRAGIAELTGVNLGGSGARYRGPETPPANRDTRDRESPGRGPRAEGPGRENRRNKRGRRGPAAGGTPRGAGPVPQPSFADPYSLPMEERMRLYKEKYGKRLAENPEPRSAPRKKGRRRRGKPSGMPGSEGAGNGSRPSGTDPNGGGPRPDPVREDPREPLENPGGPSPSAAPPSDGAGREGLFGRIFNAPRNDDSRD